jgi:hypothetical protein
MNEPKTILGVIYQRTDEIEKSEDYRTSGQESNSHSICRELFRISVKIASFLLQKRSELEKELTTIPMWHDKKRKQKCLDKEKLIQERIALIDEILGEEGK